MGRLRTPQKPNTKSTKNIPYISKALNLDPKQVVVSVLAPDCDSLRNVTKQTV